MTNDENIKKLFKEHKQEIPDNGFSGDLKDKLPGRSSPLPQLLIVLSIIAGVTLTFVLNDISVIIKHILEFISAIATLKCPSVISTVTYLTMLVMLFIIGFSLSTADSE